MLKDLRPLPKCNLRIFLLLVVSETFLSVYKRLKTDKSLTLRQEKFSFVHGEEEWRPPGQPVFFLLFFRDFQPIFKPPIGKRLETFNLAELPNQWVILR